MASSYEARLAKGEEPEYFDKEFLRLWFMDHCDPYNDATLPEAPADMVKELSQRYAAIFNRLTGDTVAPAPADIEARIRANLDRYLG
jgi:phosphoribosylaminoimidazole-succinocarboxamide synthase